MGKKSVKMSPKVIQPNKNVPNGQFKSVRPVLERLRSTAQKQNVRRFHEKSADLVPPKFPEPKNVSIEKKPSSKKFQMKLVTWSLKKICKHVTKLVPLLKPAEECVDIPKEVCSRSRTNPRKVQKPVVKKWCYVPTAQSGLA